MAKITIIRIPSLFAKGALTLSAIPPIGVAYLASSLREAGHKITIIDAIGEAIDQVHPYAKNHLFVNGLTTKEILDQLPLKTQYIFISFPFSHEWPLGKQIAFGLKQAFPQVPLIAGGEHITALPDFCLQDCEALDFCVLGEGEITSNELVTALEKGSSLEKVGGIAYRHATGTIKITAKRQRIFDIDSIPKPAWDLIPLETYLSGGYSFGVNIGRTIPIMASRGCPYACTFCSNPKMWGRHWMPRSPEKVVEEMEEYISKYNVQNFDFYDLTAIIKRDWIIKMSQLIIDKKLNMTWQLPSGTRAEVLDKEVTALLYQSGCRNISYAPESGSRRILKLIKKKADLDQMLSSMKAAAANRINLKANIIFGFPQDTLKDILQSYLFIIRMAVVGVHDTSVWTFSAYPGSELFEDLRRQNKLPPFTNEYFFSLLSYSDIRQAVSWNERFSNRQLKFLRLFGLFLFYAVNYTIRPIRLFNTIKNIVRHKPESRLEMIVEKSLSRHKSG